MSGEMSNYETAIAEIQRMIDLLRLAVEAANAALAIVATTKGTIDAWQTSRNGTVAAVRNAVDSLAAVHLDPTTMGLATDAAETLDANRLSQVFAQFEDFEVKLTAARDADEVALVSLEEQKKHLEREYAEHAANVKANLQGDATFVDSAGAGGGGATSGDNSWVNGGHGPGAGIGRPGPSSTG